MEMLQRMMVMAIEMFQGVLPVPQSYFRMDFSNRIKKESKMDIEAKTEFTARSLSC